MANLLKSIRRKSAQRELTALSQDPKSILFRKNLKPGAVDRLRRTLTSPHLRSTLSSLLKVPAEEVQAKVAELTPDYLYKLAQVIDTIGRTIRNKQLERSTQAAPAGATIAES